MKELENKNLDGIVKVFYDAIDERVHKAVNDKISQLSLLPEAMQIIDMYLNAGHKMSRAVAHGKAKELYKKYYGKDYKNLDKR